MFHISGHCVCGVYRRRNTSSVYTVQSVDGRREEGWQRSSTRTYEIHADQRIPNHRV